MRKGFVALGGVLGLTLLTVGWVHLSQTNERLAMRAAVLRDIEKLCEK